MVHHLRLRARVRVRTPRNTDVKAWSRRCCWTRGSVAIFDTHEHAVGDFAFRKGMAEGTGIRVDLAIGGNWVVNSDSSDFNRQAADLLDGEYMTETE